MRKKRDNEIIRHEELVKVDTTWRGIGYLKARKLIDKVKIDEFVDRDVEQLEYESRPPEENDSGKIETLEDGSLSIPVYEEQVVVTKRIVLRERVIIRKQTITERERVKVDLRREHVSVEADPGIEVTTDTADEQP